MKGLLKKVFSFILIFFIIFTVTACNKEEEENNINYSIQINVTSELYVGEEANYEVVLIEKNEILTNYQFSSSNSEILKVNKETIEGVNEGTAEIIISCVVDDKKVENSVTITVKEEPVLYSLLIELDGLLYEGSSTTFKVKENTTGTIISNFECFVEDETVAKYKNGELLGLQTGKTILHISAVFENQTISNKIEVVVNELEIKYELVTNIPLTIYKNQMIDVSVKVMPDNVSLDKFNIISSNESIMMYFSDENSCETFSTGNVELTIKAEYNGVKIVKIVAVEVLETPYLRIELPENITNKEPFNYKVFLMPADTEVIDYTFTTANSNLLIIEKGKIIPITFGKGRILITTSYNDLQISNSFELTINKYIPKVLDSNIRTVIFINEVINLDMKLMPDNVIIDEYNVESSNENIISYDDGKLIANDVGSCVIKILYNDLVFEYEITVGEEIKGINIVIDKDKLLKNEVLAYKVIAEPSKLQISNYEYNLSNNLLLINKDVLFAKEIGNDVINVKYTYQGITYEDSFDVTVEGAVYQVERIFITSSNGLFKEDSLELTVNIYPSISNQNVTINYSSSNDEIIRIDENIAYGVEKGIATIIATLKDNEDIYSKLTIYVIVKNELSETTDAIHNGNSMLARYYEDSVLEYNALANGVIQTTYLGYTSTQLPGDVDGYKGLEGDIVLDQYYSQQINVLQVPSSNNLKVVPWANLDGHKWTLTTVKGLIENYEKHNPGYKVIAAVNGDFFDINGGKNLPYSTTGENISNGEFYKTSNDFGAGGGTIGFTNDGSNNTLLGITDAVVSSYFVLSIYDENNNIIGEYRIENYNKAPNTGESSVYYGEYDSSKSYVGIETLEQNTWIIESAELALPNNNYGDFYGLGVISSTEKTTLKKGQFAITTNNADIQNALKIGVKVRVQREYLDEFANVTSATGYNGVIFDDSHGVSYTDGNLLNRAPRTVIGMKEDGTLVMMVVDGRQGAKGMFGCDGYELAAIMQAYGCVKAYNVDGGGSSTMIIRDGGELRVLNSPSDGNERNDGNCILICTYDPMYNCEVNDLTSSSVTLNINIDNEDFQNYPIYVEFDSELYEVNNNVITFDNLVHNTKYDYRIYYQKDDELIPTQTVGYINAPKDKFAYLGLVVEETDILYSIKVYYEDIDKASNINEMSVLINNMYYYYCNNGAISIEKDKIDNVLENIILEYYYYDIYGNKVEVKLDNPLYFLM